MMERTNGIGIAQILGIIVVFFLGITIISTGVGCAGMTPPTGGPRDSLPPVIMNVAPKDSTLKFTGKKIELSFDEFVQVQDVQKNLLVSPLPKINPTIEARLRNITVTIRDTLEENTTYVLDFGNAIRDMNESNILRNYRYVFSTGNSIDSLELGGRVVIAETGKTDSTIIVMLHTSFDDSAVVKDRPRYVTRSDTAGYFRFENLAPGRYAIYALKEEGGAYRYLSKDQLFAFYDSAVTSQSQKKDILLYAYEAIDTAAPKGIAPLPVRRRTDQKSEFLQVQTNVEEGQDLLSPLTFTFSEVLESFDSTKISFTDTLFKPITNYSFRRDTSGKKISLVYPWQENTFYTVVLDSMVAMDTLGRKLPINDTITFQTKRNSQYGLVRLRFINLPLNRKPILQLVQGEEVRHTHIFTNNQFYAPLFVPGDYEMRLVFDENRNGKWDTGNFFGEKKQPEKVQLIPRKLNVKPNWDSEIDIQL